MGIGMVELENDGRTASGVTCAKRVDQVLRDFLVSIKAFHFDLCRPQFG